MIVKFSLRSTSLSTLGFIRTSAQVKSPINFSAVTSPSRSAEDVSWPHLRIWCCHRQKFMHPCPYITTAVIEPGQDTGTHFLFVGPDQDPCTLFLSSPALSSNHFDEFLRVVPRGSEGRLKPFIFFQALPLSDIPPLTGVLLSLWSLLCLWSSTTNPGR